MSKQQFITKAQVAAMFGVDVRSVTTWQNDQTDPLPVAVQGGRGKPHKYDIAQVHSWGVRRTLSDLAGTEDGQVYDFQKERARLTHEQADKVALENAQLRGELIASDVLRQTLVESYASIRAHLLAAPSNHALQLFEAEDLDELRTRLTGIMETLLQELAVNELSADAVSRIEGAAESAANAQTAAAA